MRILKKFVYVYDKIIDVFAPEWFKDSKKSEDIVFVPVVILCLVISAFFLLLYIVYFFIITPDNLVKNASNIFGFFLILGIAFWVKKTKHNILPPVITLFFISYILTSISVYNTGGIYSIDLLWLMFVLIITVLFIGVRWGLVFNLLLAVIVVAFFLLEQYGFKSFWDDHTSTKGKHQLFTLLFLQLFIFLILGSFSRILKQTRKELDLASKIKIQELDQRVKQQTEEIENIRTKIARDFHDEFGNKLAGFSMTTYVLQEKLKGLLNEEALALFNKLDQDAKGVFSRGKDFIYSIRNTRMSLKDVFTYIKDFGDELFHLTDVHFSATLTSVQDTFEVETYDLILTVKEILTNSYKHSGANRVEVSVIQDENTISVEIKDNGKGFDTKKIYKGFGLESIKDRITNLNGALDLTSNASGTTYRIKLYQNTSEE